MSLDVLSAFVLVYLVVWAPWVVAGVLLLGAVAWLGAWWQRRQCAGAAADQRTAFADLARKLAAAEATAARLRDRLMDEQRDRILADERATAYAHRAQHEKSRADAAAGVSRDLRRALTTAREEVARAVAAGESKPTGGDDDPDRMDCCGIRLPLTEQRDHLITEHGVDPVDVKSLVRIPGTMVDPR